MTPTFSFEKIIAWQKAHEFTIMVYNMTKTFPEEERFGLTSQFRRAAISLEANIAEGYKKLSKADKLRFFNISEGSLALRICCLLRNRNILRYIYFWKKQASC